jgi:DNA-directed RNA polymerase subunit L
MMTESITEARYIKNGRSIKIKLSQMTKELYNKEYRGYLYCPNEACNAKVSYASGDIIAPYFKTWKPTVKDGAVTNEHVKDCIYGVEHDLQERNRRLTDPNYLIALSEKHIKDVLNNAYKKLFKSDDDVEQDKKVRKQRKKSPSSTTDKTSTALISGKAGYTVDGAIEKKDREPNVYSLNINDIADKHYNDIFCVIGAVSDMIISNKSAEIKLINNQGKTSRILFNEAFSVTHSAMFRDLGTVKSYIDTLKAQNTNVICCCLGKIIKDDYDISVIPNDPVEFRINNKDYYAIVVDSAKRKHGIPII